MQYKSRFTPQKALLRLTFSLIGYGNTSTESTNILIVQSETCIFSIVAQVNITNITS